jgi:hypothetical protein
MKDHNKKLAIGEELRRSDEAYQAAELLFKNGLIADAVSKLYYHLLYHTRALLISKDLEPRSHEVVLRLFGLHFVKPGIFKPGSSHVLSKMMKFREEADYNPAYMFTEEDYKRFLGDVSGVVTDIRRYLSESGMI